CGLPRPGAVAAQPSSEERSPERTARTKVNRAERTTSAYADQVTDAKRIILARRARFLAAAMASCTPATPPVESVRPSVVNDAVPPNDSPSSDLPPIADAGLSDARKPIA